MRLPTLSFLLLALMSCSKSPALPVNNNNPGNPGVPATTADSTPAQYGTPFPSVPNRQDAIIYQVNIRAFSAAGNFQGVISRLDSIQALGINVIYLMPIYPVGLVKSVNSPYCVRDYLSINSDFGTLADLRALVDGAHARGMSVMLDWVANHTSWDNPWITAHKSWYQQDGAGNIVSPSGYNDVAQLNFSNDTMRLQMISDMKYWVYKANVDGFRCDFADHPPLDFWQQAIDTLRNISSHKLLILAEGSRNANFTAGFDYNFGFNFYGNLKSIFSSDRSVLSIDSLNASDYADAANGQQIVRYLTNHDVNSSDGTPLSLFDGEPGSLAAFAVVALMKGVPMIYDGQEVGMTTPITFPFTSVKIDWTPNPSVTNAYKAILGFRNSSDAIREGSLVSYDSPDACVFTKSINGSQVLVIVNLRSIPISYSAPSALQHTSWKDAFTGVGVTIGTTLSLAPFAYQILVNP